MSVTLSLKYSASDTGFVGKYLMNVTIIIDVFHFHVAFIVLVNKNILCQFPLFDHVKLFY